MNRWYRAESALLCFAVLAGLLSRSVADASPWLPPGDQSMRHDIYLLADAGVIHAPVTTWPLSWPDIARDVLRVDEARELHPAIAGALARVREAARKASDSGLSAPAWSLAAAESPAPFRTFEDSPREEGELTVGSGWMGESWIANIELSVVSSPVDEQSFRLDGSYAGLMLGNFAISVGSMDRWWGPGWDGSLILSNNARPIPGVAIERNYSDPIRLPPLKWLGPLRLTVALGRMEGSDVAMPDARFFAARLNARPASWLELGLSRTAQWCGKGRPCDLDTFGDLLAGRDNRSADLTEAQEPGNQMAGYDFRLRSPWRRVPVALYGQFIGEDEAGGLPSRFLGLIGAEAWVLSGRGSYRMHLECADTRCDFSRQTPQLGCAYRNELYPQGYAFRGRVIGHSIGGDRRMYALGALFARSADSWSLLGRRIEPKGGPATRVPITSFAGGTLENLELQYNRAFARGALGIGLGLDQLSEPSSTEVRGFVQWKQGF